jgi:hypothetical protein
MTDIQVLVDAALRWAGVVQYGLDHGGYGKGKRARAAEQKVQAIHDAAARLGGGS